MFFICARECFAFRAITILKEERKKDKKEKRKPIKRMAWQGCQGFWQKNTTSKNCLPLKERGGDFFAKTCITLKALCRGL
jgi:hypothetical protein